MKRNGRLLRALLCAALIMLALAVGAAAADTATETWLAASGNQLWVGGEQVTAENADNITGSGIEGTVSFAVKDGVPTLTLNGATITGGKKVNRSGVYVQPVYCPGADLTVVLSGDNRIVPAAQENAATVGFLAPGVNDGSLTITGDENATLEVRVERSALYIDKNVTIRGGKCYTFHSGSGYYNEKGFYANGELLIEGATLIAESDNACGIYAADGTLTIRNSTVTATGNSSSANTYAGISANCQFEIYDSTVTATGSAQGIWASSYYGIYIAGDSTVVKATAAAGQAAMVVDFYTDQYWDIDLGDGLAVAAPAGGRITWVDPLDSAMVYHKGYTIVDSEGNVASSVTIHKHSFTREAAEEKYKKSDATCTSPAKYYYSCSIEQDGSACGAAGTTTFAHGDKAPGNHTGAPGDDWKHDATGHWKEYTCCHAKTAQAGHTNKAPEREHEVAAACEAAGSYDEVVYCEVCGGEVSRTSHTIPATGHTDAPVAKENEVAATCETDGGYDDVVYCEVCRRELSRTSHTIPATGHVWGDWVVTTPATVNAAGVETKTCKNDPSHTMTRAIKKLTPTTGTVGVPSVRDVPAAGAEAAKTVFSACAGSRACPIHPFEDASSAAWYHDGVHYCLDAGLMTGVGGGRFAPEGGMTRAMLVAVLYRLEGEPDADGGAAFTDVAADAWYAEAVGWAAAEGIVDGYGDGRFGPDDALTREQLAAILYRYARYRGLAAAADEALTRYADAAQIADYAVSALHWACGSGLVGGMVQNGRAVLLPASAVTRAQTAAILQRLCTKLL